MTQAVTLTEAGAAPQGLAARIVGVLLSPGATYAAVVSRPHVLGVLAFVVIVSASVWFAFLSTTVGQDAMYNQQMDAMESFGFELPPQAYEQMEQMLPYMRYQVAGSQLVVLPVLALFISGLILGIFNAVMGGSATFKQVYAVVAHSGVVLAVHSLFMAPLNYARESMSSPSTLRAFTPFLDQSSFAGGFLGLIDLFHVWWIVNLSIGVAVLYRKRTAPIASSALAAYAVLVLILAAVFARLSGGQ